MSRSWEGAQSLEPLLVPIESVSRHARNPRRGDVALIAEMLNRFGQLKPIVVDADGTVLAGNHVHLAAQERLGWTHVAVVKADHLDGAEALKYLVADNRATDAATYDWDEYADVLRDLMSQIEDVAAEARSLGFLSEHDYQRAIDDADKAASKAFAPDDWAGGEGDLETDFTCGGCGYQWSGKST